MYQFQQKPKESAYSITQRKNEESAPLSSKDVQARVRQMKLWFDSQKEYKESEQEANNEFLNHTYPEIKKEVRPEFQTPGDMTPTLVQTKMHNRAIQLREQEEDIRQNKPAGMNRNTYLKLSDPQESAKMEAQAKFSKFKKTQAKQFKKNRQAITQFNSKVNNFERALIQCKIDYGSEKYNMLLSHYFPDNAIQSQDTTLNSQEQNNSTLQKKNDAHSIVSQKAAQNNSSEENNTCLPDKLKAGTENLSGYTMDDVKVHRNSDKPAQLNAHAFTQGTDIHVGPGQEKHIPHEAWHAVQQKQGRVKPTMQMRGENINDDTSLEKEADVMGSKAANHKTNENFTIQKRVEDEADMYSQVEKPKENSSRAVANSVRQKKNNLRGSCGFVDNRTDAVAQFGAISKSLIQGQKSKDSSMKLARNPVQKMVIQSPGYKLNGKNKENGWSLNLFNKISKGWQYLDNATEKVRLKVDNCIKTGKLPQTRHWGAFVKRQTPANYGYLIEEGLNEYARGAGWATQVSLKGARPDFARKLRGKYAMADLTTTSQSKGSGMHLAEKLNNSNFNGKEFVAAADITYDRDGKNTIPIIPARQECIARFDRVMKERDNDDYNPKNIYLMKKLPDLPNKTESDPDVWQSWLDTFDTIENKYNLRI